MHSWSNDKVDWQGISDAAEYIGGILRKWGRVPVSQTKEKYGTARVYTDFGWWQLFSVTHPGYAYSRYPRWLWLLDCNYLCHAVVLLNPIVVPLQKMLYTYAYGLALERWPHLRQEILDGADHSDLLTKYGVHSVRDSEHGYTRYLDWHPDNYTVREKDRIEEERQMREVFEAKYKDPVQWIKRDYNV